MTLFIYIVIFIYGILIGSFLNVCIYRIPHKENIVTTPSHCMKCGYRLKWYDLFPIVSYLFLHGRCRKCRTKISIQYPLIELGNGIFYVIIFLVNGFHMESVIFCFLTSALIVLSIIDFKTLEIPFGINLFIALLGIIRLGLDYKNWVQYVIGFCSVSLFLLILYKLTKGRGIGGGDIKLMAAAGLILGWKLILVAFLWGCILGSILHSLRMLIRKDSNVLAFGPYLSMGIFLAILYGEKFLQWYLQLCIG